MEHFFTSHYVHTNLVPTDIYPIQYGEEQCQPSHHFGPCVRNNYLIHYVYSGTGIFRIQGKEYHLQSGQLFLIPPNCSTYYKADDTSPWLYRWIEFNGSFAEKLLSRAGLSQSSPVLAPPSPDAGCALQTLVEGGEKSFEQVMALFWNFMNQLIGNNDTNIAEDNTTHYVTAAELYIQNNLHKSLSVNSVANYIGIDRSYLCRLFTETKGLSPKQYIDTQKMNRAVQYLKLNNLSVTEIALSLGYCDCHAFHKAFKKHFGCSPGIWRKKTEFEQTIQMQKE